MKIKIAEVGNFFKSTTKINYNSSRSFLDFDMVIINVNLAIYSLKQSPIFIQKRGKQLEEYVTHHKMPIIFFVSEEFILLANGRHYDMDEIFPVSSFVVENEAGLDIKICSNTIFSNLLARFRKKFSYSSFFTNYIGTVLMETPNGKPLSFYNDSSLFLPELKLDIAPDEEEFLFELYSIAKTIQKPPVEFKLPDWSAELLLPSEKQITLEIEQLKNQLDEVKNQLKEKKILLSEIEKKKILFTGKGEILELSVKGIFTEIGFEIIPTEKNRDDLIIKYKGQIAVAEIKGTKGSAKEENSAQLEKWVSGFYEENKIEPKGILIVNGFIEKKLDERTETMWPDQMLKYSERKGLCLISGLQLLGLYFEALNNPELKDDLIKSLFTTIGIYPKFKNWKQFITINEQPVINNNE